MRVVYTNILIFINENLRQSMHEYVENKFIKIVAYFFH